MHRVTRLLLVFTLAATGGAFAADGPNCDRPLTLALHHGEGIPLLDLLRSMTSAPAQLLRMKEGRIGAGLPADFVLFDPGCRWEIDTLAMRSKSKNSPFDGHSVQGRAMSTIVGGRHVYSLLA